MKVFMSDFLVLESEGINMDKILVILTARSFFVQTASHSHIFLFLIRNVFIVLLKIFLFLQIV